MDLFERIKAISTSELSESEVKKMVAEIIDTMKKRHITYDQANEVLCVTSQTLLEMSRALEL